MRADCANCCALCCVAPAFDADQGFGFSKPARTPCVNLRDGYRCAIHGALERLGFPSCAAFDCYGAGQRVTQRLFAGKSWATAPKIAQEMFNAYYKYRLLHELMAGLESAMQKVSARHAQRLQESFLLIDAACESGQALSDTFQVNVAASMGQRNTVPQLSRWSSKAQCLARSLI